MPNQVPTSDATLGDAASTRIREGACAAMRREIASAGGREVFFAGRLDAEGLVDSVRVCARGHESAVPAFLDALQLREVVLHNHPTGNIGPSEADLDVAQICGHNGHGAYIVDNEVERVYVVVEPFLEEERQRLDAAKLAKVIGAKGALARQLPSFEVRPQQAEMMEAVSQAFNEDRVAVIEAPTGVGKTFAYLVPAVQWSLQNKERVVVSTRTINLQEQIVFKDVPLLQKCLGETFSAVLVKGRSNYVCRRKLDKTLSEATLFDDEDTQETLRLLAEWVHKTKDGSRSDLPFVPTRELWERVCSEVDTCAGGRCPAAKMCFFTRARREVAKADLIVANHHILFSDIAIKKETGDFSGLAVLPAYKRVVFDEAHSIEDSATEYFGMSATRNGALALLNLFIRKERGQERGLVPYIRAKLVRESIGVDMRTFDAIEDLVQNELLPALAAAREILIAAFDAVRRVTAECCKQVGRDIKWRLTDAVVKDQALRDVHDAYMVPAAKEVQGCVKLCLRLCSKLKEIHPRDREDEPPFFTEMLQLQGYQGRLEVLANVLAEALVEESLENTVRWVEIDSHRKTYVRVARCPLDVGKPLAEGVYGNLKTVVMTSATLSVRRGFDYLFRRIGLDRIENERIDCLLLDSPFDFQKQALLCITRELVPPDSPKFLDECVEAVKRCLAATGGHTLLLFTSFYALDYTYRRVHDILSAAGITALKQGEATRTQLLDRFRSDVSSVLFATDSFWEGIDVVGDALKCVVLAKLPFRVPTEPIIQARGEAIEEAGGNPFVDYTVPQAVIKFRQGFGRLIRHKGDRGAIVVLDRRVVTKYYGRVFLDSLPGSPVVAGGVDAVQEALNAFFNEAGDGQVPETSESE